MIKFSLPIKLLISSLLAIAIIAGVSALYLKRALSVEGPLQEQVKIVVPKGASSRKIAEILSENNIIDNSHLFVLLLKLSKESKNMQAGEYEFSPGVSAKEIIEKMASGDTVVHSVTIAEGLTTEQILQKILNIIKLEGEIPEGIGEGELLPETYHFRLGDSRESIVRRMQENMKRTLEAAWENRAEDIAVKSKEEALVLASIVEKETGVAEERSIVASVFNNRLKKNMRLQSDPTVIYGITKGKYVLERQLSKSDLKADNEYNTYINVGLPPTSIANPGVASIEAVVNPDMTNFLYFVSDGNGGHQFSASLDEHNANVTKLRKWEREQRLLEKSKQMQEQRQQETEVETVEEITP